MSDARALVLSTGKPLFDAARAAFAAEVEYLDLHAGEASGGRLTVPSFDHERETLATVDRLMAKRPFRYVLATSESNLAFAAFLRSRYGLPGLGFEAALTVTNKWRMKQWIRPSLPTARCWLSGDLATASALGALPPEVVVKPLSGSSSKGVRRMPVERAQELAAAGDELFLVEEAVDAECELHVDGVVRGGELRATFASAYDRPVLSAAGTTRASIHLPPGDPRREPALRAAERAVAALGIADFVFHLELFQVGDRLLFNEVALRPAGGGVAESLREFHGVDLWDEFVRIQLGRPPGSGLSAGSGPAGFSGVIGVAAPSPGSRRRVPEDSELLAVPGIVGVSPGSSRAESEAGLGSSCAFSRLAFFSCPDEAAVHAALAGVGRLSGG
ncbi:acetyl-CoA carboxylase biotin carboxylase subunit family protein [Streptomyces sp. NPDC050516]|uniref:acetyl-CoA carboxylase biotin carboxylase subunit family protein n=1 Tax=Streptomyces sp. NPDC050516 TaxID=3365621 RepID=UPI0037AFEA88